MATHRINSFLQHLMNEGMTTTGTQGRGGSSRPEQRSGDGTHPKDQSTEDGGIIPYVRPVEDIDFLDDLIRDRYPQFGDPASPDAIDPGMIDYIRNVFDRRQQYTPGREPTIQDMLDFFDAGSEGYPAKTPQGEPGKRRGIGGWPIGPHTSPYPFR